jgi:hypothetical protein
MAPATDRPPIQGLANDYSAYDEALLGSWVTILASFAKKGSSDVRPSPKWPSGYSEALLFCISPDVIETGSRVPEGMSVAGRGDV